MSWNRIHYYCCILLELQTIFTCSVLLCVFEQRGSQSIATGFKADPVCELYVVDSNERHYFPLTNM